MELEAGQVAVVTGAASGIGRALAGRFAAAGLHVVLADVDVAALDVAAAEVAEQGVDTLAVVTDVSRAESVEALAQATIDRFGAVRVVCNNAGVVGRGDAWTGPLAQWEWTMGVNFYGVVNGIRAFLPHLVLGGGGAIANTASIAGLMPGFSAAYDASKHAVVAVTEDLYNDMQAANLGVSVHVVCPGWVRTNLMDAERNWPTELGATGEPMAGSEVLLGHVSRAISEGLTPAAVADAVHDAVLADRFWVIPHDDFFALAVQRWERMAQRLDPEPFEHVPGLPPRTEMIEEMLRVMGVEPA